MSRLLASSAAVALLSGTALAADLPLPVEPVPVAPAVAPTYNWTGVYFGPQGGFAWGSSDASFTLGAPPLSYDPDGWFVGGHLGASYQWNWLVIGVEGDAEWTDINGSDSTTAGLTSAGSIDVNWQASIRGRVGVAFDRVLAYATGGAAYANVDVAGGPPGGPFGNYSDSNWGWTVGGGVDFAILDHLIAGVEYRYTDFGDFSGGLNPPFPVVTETVDLRTHAIRGRVSYKFP